MKTTCKIFMILFVSVANICCSVERKQECNEITYPDTISRVYEDSIEHLATAFAMVESRCNENAVSKNGKYVGWLQIGMYMVRQANRYAGTDIYDSDTRKTVEGSLNIFSTIMREKNPSLDIRTACKIWNPKAGEWYYEKVKDAYEQLDWYQD